MILAVLALMTAAAYPAAAQTSGEDYALSLNTTLGNMTPVEPCVLSGQCAIGHVYVNVTEPSRPAGITGFFSFEPFDLEGFAKQVSSFFSGLFGLI